jgi:hypothetical protein
MPTEATSPASRLTSTLTSAVYSAFTSSNCPQNLSPTSPAIFLATDARLQKAGFKPSPAPQAIPLDGTALLSKEVLRRIRHGNKKAAFCSGFVVPNKPSDGLEPSTPSLPSSDEAGTAGKAGKSRARRPRKKKESAEDE